MEMKEALRLNARFGEACKNDPAFSEMADGFLELIRKTDFMMAESGVVEACTRCAVKTGSCCFREMGESYSPVQLFLNLLLGAAMPSKTSFPGGCRFVGEKGCTLPARHAFCLNYFCPDLKKSLGDGQIDLMQRVIGEQLMVGWDLELMLAEWIADADEKTEIGPAAR